VDVTSVQNRRLRVAMGCFLLFVQRHEQLYFIAFRITCCAYKLIDAANYRMLLINTNNEKNK
jgi:hypothetical protein